MAPDRAAPSHEGRPGSRRRREQVHLHCALPRLGPDRENVGERPVTPTLFTSTVDTAVVAEHAGGQRRHPSASFAHVDHVGPGDATAASIPATVGRGCLQNDVRRPTSAPVGGEQLRVYALLMPPVR